MKITNVFKMSLFSLYVMNSFGAEIEISRTIGFTAMPESMSLAESLAMVEWFEIKNPLTFVGKHGELERWYLATDDSSHNDQIDRSHERARLNAIRFEYDNVTMYMSFTSGGDDSARLSVHPQTVQFLQNACLHTDTITFMCDAVKKIRDRAQIHATDVPVVIEKHKYIIKAINLYDALLNILHQNRDGDLPECYKKIIMPYARDLSLTQEDISKMYKHSTGDCDLIFEAFGVGMNRTYRMVSDERRAPITCAIVDVRHPITLSRDDAGNVTLVVRNSNAVCLELQIYEFLLHYACYRRKEIFFIDMLDCDKYYNSSF